MESAPLRTDPGKLDLDIEGEDVYHIEVKQHKVKADGSLDYGVTIYEQIVPEVDLWRIIAATNRKESV